MPAMYIAADPVSGAVVAMTPEEQRAFPAVSAALMAYAPNMIAARLQEIGLTPHQAGPGLVDYLTALQNNPCNRGRLVVHTLALMLQPEQLAELWGAFVPTPPPGVSQAAADGAFHKLVGRDAAAISARAIAVTLVTRGVLRVAATLTCPAQPGSVRMLVAEDALVVLANALMAIDIVPGAFCDPGLYEFFSQEPLLAGSLPKVAGMLAQLTPAYLVWFANLVSQLSRLASCLHPTADLVNFLAEALATRGSEVFRTAGEYHRMDEYAPRSHQCMCALCVNIFPAALLPWEA